MRLIGASGRPLTACLGAVALTVAVLMSYANAADRNEPAETTGAFHAVAFKPLPQGSRIEIRLMDDSPENLEIGWGLHQELQRRGYTAGEGKRFVLTIETDVSIAPGAGGPDQTAAGETRDLDVIGFLRATLDEAATEERVWAAEAAYRRSDGDLPAGAKSLAPLLVEQIGRSVELDSVTIR